MDFVGWWTPFWLKDGFYVYIRCVAFVITIIVHLWKKGSLAAGSSLKKKRSLRKKNVPMLSSLQSYGFI